MNRVAACQDLTRTDRVLAETFSIKVYKNRRRLSQKSICTGLLLSNGGNPKDESIKNILLLIMTF